MMRPKTSSLHFGSKKNKGLSHRSAIGISITQNAITLVQLSSRSVNQIQLEKYVIAKLPKNIIKGTQVQDYEQLTVYLERSFAELGAYSPQIVADIPHILTTIEFLEHRFEEGSNKDEIEQFVEFEVAQIAPIEEMNFDYQVLSSQGKHCRLMLVATHKNEVEPRIEMFENAGITLSALDVDLFAQANAFNGWINQHSPELAHDKIGIIGIHATQMYALIMQNGQILYKQEMPVSAEQLNHLIQRTYQVNEEKADHMMRTTAKPSDYQVLVADRFNMQVAQDIQRVLQFYYTTQPSEDFTSIQHLFLTGIAAQQQGMAETVFTHTNTPTEYLHPILYTQTGKQIDPASLQIDAPALTLAFGLALRGVQSS